MPDGQDLKYIVSRTVKDLKEVRMPGAAKPFEQLTIGELVQLRPGGAAADSYNVNAVGSDVTVSTSSALSELAQIRGQEAVRAEVAAHRLRSELGTAELGRKIVTKFPGE